jgi:hypothetical protein
VCLCSAPGTNVELCSVTAWPNGTEGNGKELDDLVCGAVVQSIRARFKVPVRSLPPFSSCAATRITWCFAVRHASGQRISALTLPSQKRTRLKVIGESVEQRIAKMTLRSSSLLPSRAPDNCCIERVPAHTPGHRLDAYRGKSPTVDLVLDYKESNQSPNLSSYFREWVNWSRLFRREPLDSPAMTRLCVVSGRASEQQHSGR